MAKRSLPGSTLTTAPGGHHQTLRLAGLFLALLLAAGCQSNAPLSPNRGAPAESAVEQADTEPPDPDRPPPVLPPVAFFLGKYAALELTITAGPDGTLQKVVISKPSRARLYDEYTRKWVEEHWKMPPAKPGQPAVRTFIAPIVYPKDPARPKGGYYPAPDYPLALLEAHIEGLLILEISVASDGKVEGVQIGLSSGHRELDDYTANWVRKHWKFPPGKERMVEWPVSYLIKDP